MCHWHIAPFLVCHCDHSAHIYFPPEYTSLFSPLPHTYGNIYFRKATSQIDILVCIFGDCRESPEFCCFLQNSGPVPLFANGSDTDFTSTSSCRFRSRRNQCRSFFVPCILIFSISILPI